MSPHVRNWTIGAVALFAFGVYVITSNVDPNATLNRQPVKAAAKPVPPPVVIKAPNPPVAAKAKPAEPGSVTVFEGGKFGNERTSTETPRFTVGHDWEFEIELKGDVWSVQLWTFKDGKPSDPAFGSDLYRADQPTSRIVKSVAAGGEYQFGFHANGVWKVTIRQGTGKL